MPEINIRLWDGAFNISKGELVLFNEQQQSEFSYYVAEKALPTPFAAYAIKDLGREYTQVLPYFLKYTKWPDAHVLSDGIETEYSRFFALWDTAINHLAHGSHFTLWNELHQLSTIVAKTLEGADSIVRSLLFIAQDMFVSELFDQGLYQGSLGRKAPYWKYMPRTVHHLRDLRTQSLFTELRLTGWQNSIKRIEQILQDLNKWDLEAQLLFYSAYCRKAAELDFLREEYCRALLFIHRTVDYYLQHLCAQEGLIGRNIKGTTQYNYSNEPVSLFNSLKELRQHGILLLKSDTIASCESINVARNKSMLTHAMDGQDKASVEAFLETTDQMLKKLSSESHGQLRTYVKHLSYQWSECPVNMIFVKQPDLDVFLREVTY